jgi:RNA polymerase sigma-70 factor, ECF subfamily
MGKLAAATWSPPVALPSRRPRGLRAWLSLRFARANSRSGWSQVEATSHLKGVKERPRRLPVGRRPAPLSDLRTFEDLYFRLSQRLLLFMTRRTADPEIAADLWSETWARAYESRQGFRGGSRAEQEGWVFGIARHVLAGFYKRGVAEGRAMERLGLERPVLDDHDLAHLERLAGMDELRTLVSAALGKVPASQREAVHLRVIEGLSYPQLAARLGIDEQNARARVSRGLRALGKALDAVEGARS